MATKVVMRMPKATTYSSNHPLTFREPTAAEVELSPELAQTIKAFGKSMRESLFHICVIAYGIRRRNLRKRRKGEWGGNANNQRYKDEFKKWYLENDLQSVYGKETNFTKHAMVGRLLTWVRWQIDPARGQQYIDRLPHSLSALYELQSIIWKHGDTATDEGRKTFRDLMVMPIRDGTKDNTWINRSLTVEAIKAKLEELYEDEFFKTRRDDIPPKRNAYDPRKINILRVKVHEGLYDFNRRGNKRKVKGPDMDEVRGLISAINGLIEDFGSEYFLLEHNLELIEEKYEKKKNPDFSIYITNDSDE